ncbi:hypothetical protein AAG570_003725 [Ranatra chinensis]|uniref:Uncharacterized protein n=1 Tax=Ranatra chinensis TaxID=642074 RepID=A0ABD0Y4J6_9HEMI
MRININCLSRPVREIDEGREDQLTSTTPRHNSLTAERSQSFLEPCASDPGNGPEYLWRSSVRKKAEDGGGIGLRFGRSPGRLKARSGRPNKGFVDGQKGKKRQETAYPPTGSFFWADERFFKGLFESSPLHCTAFQAHSSDALAHLIVQQSSFIEGFPFKLMHY